MDVLSGGEKQRMAVSIDLFHDVTQNCDFLCFP